MGFTTGFLSGTALTLTLTYLALSAHRINRTTQAAVLRAHTDTLNRVVDPEPAVAPTTAAHERLARRDAGREERGGIVETAKDRWNAQLAGEVRRLQTTDWRAVRERVEDGAGVVWARLRAAVAESGGGDKSGEGKS